MIVALKVGGEGFKKRRMCDVRERERGVEKVKLTGYGE